MVTIITRSGEAFSGEVLTGCSEGAPVCIWHKAQVIRWQMADYKGGQKPLPLQYSSVPLVEEVRADGDDMAYIVAHGKATGLRCSVKKGYLAQDEEERWFGDEARFIAGFLERRFRPTITE